MAKQLSFSEDAWQGTRSFGRWNNLGGGLTQVPVAIRTQKGIECFVGGENKEPLVDSWDGTRWSGFKSMGGQRSIV